MDLSLTDEQQALVAGLTDLYGKHSTPERVRAAEPLGFDRSLWKHLFELGLVAMAVDEAAGGLGASDVDLALAAELQGRFTASAPLIEAQVAARLLASIGCSALDAVLQGERIVTLALHPAVGDAVRGVPAGAVADDVIVLQGETLRLVPLEGRRTAFENTASMPLADIDLSGAPGAVIATGRSAVDVHTAAVDDWLRLTSAALVGLGARALALGVEYVKERKAWGVPIGSFQSVAHRLADSASALDGAWLLAFEAAWAPSGDPGRAQELAATAFAFAYESARDAAERSLQFHGGYGFTMEYDIQLYWRRAVGWAGVYGEPTTAYRRAADARYGRL